MEVKGLQQFQKTFQYKVGGYPDDERPTIIIRVSCDIPKGFAGVPSEAEKTMSEILSDAGEKIADLLDDNIGVRRKDLV